MFSEKTEQLSRVLAVFDTAVTCLAFIIAYDIQAIWGQGGASLFSHVALLPLVLALVLYFLTYFGAYESPRTASNFSYGWSVLRSIVVSIVLLLTLLFLLKIQYVSRSIVLGFAAMDVVMLTLVRVAALRHFRNSIKEGDNNLKVVVIGTGPRAVRLAETLRTNAEWGLDIIGHLDPDASLVGTEVKGVRVLGTAADISTVLKEHVVDEVILAVPRAMISDVDSIAQACEEEGVRLRFMADVFDVRVARMRLVSLGDIPLLTLEAVAQDEAKLMVKRTLDLAVTLLVMPVLLPLFAVIAIAIKLDSPGPVFFVQQRVGMNKRRFPLLKFRTMVVDAEARMKDIEHLNEARGPIFKIKDDPRVTRVGRFLRRTSLDETPQFINVFRGDISLVGPRPMSIRDVDLFDKGLQRKRFSVKPGLACLREVSGRSELSFADWLDLDLQYIDNWSLGLDFKILLKLVPAVVRGSGAV